MTAQTRPAAPAPPVAEPRPGLRRVHGVDLDTSYDWLRAENWRAVMRDPAQLDPAIRAYLEAENAWADAFFADSEALRRTLVAEMRGRIKEDDSTVPLPDGPYAYAVRYRTGGQHPMFVREPRAGGETTLLLDGDALAEGKGYFRFGGVAHSPDHRRLAWSADETGGEYFPLRVRDLATGADLPDVVPETSGNVAWANDGRTILYTRLDAEHRPSRVYAHVLGTDPATDRLVYEERDPGYFVSIGRLRAGRFIVIQASDHQTSEVRLVDADDPLAPPRLVAPREEGHEYDIDHRGDELVIRTNADGAEDFKIMLAPLASPSRENWRELVPHRPGTLILSVEALAGHIIRLERVDGLARIVVRRMADGDEHIIAFAEEAYSLGLTVGYEFDTTAIRFDYSSLTTPPQTFDYDVETRARVLRKTREIPSGHDPEAYETRRLFAPARDGEQVPVSLLRRRSTPLDGTAPLLLYGYGAYGHAIPAAFQSNVLSLVDRGFVFAIAHVRGGKDKGYRWYREGRGRKKVNTFDDFIAAAEYLAAEGWTSPGRIGAQGGSAGGMLMGAVANRAPPGLFGAIVAEVPFVDVLATMLDASLPLTPPEWPEWGNPIASEEDFRTILAYSPVDNVTARDYPAIFALAGISDPRVTYWEPARWVAKLRRLRTNDAPLLLRTNMEAGHGGAAGRFQRLEEVALIYAFLLKVLGGAAA